MKAIARATARLLIRDYDKTEDPDVRSRYGAVEGWGSIFLNFLLFAVKFFAGFAIGSIAIIADAIHSLSDTATSIVVIIGFRVARKPSDSKHPFGHGRAETIAALVVSILLIVGAVELGRESVTRFAHPRLSSVPFWTIIVLAATFVVKEAYALFSRELGRMIDSDAIQADFWHHRTDSITTLLVVAALVVEKVNPGLSWLDGLAGVLVAVVIAGTGIALAVRTTSVLLGEAPSKETIARIVSTADAHDNVDGVHEVMVHQYGTAKLISLHIEVNDALSALDAHDLAERVEAAVASKFGDASCTVVAHVDPVNRDHPEYAEVEKAVKTVAGELDGVESWHDLRILGSDPEVFAAVNLTCTVAADSRESDRLCAEFVRRFCECYPGMKIAVKIEKHYPNSG